MVKGKKTYEAKKAELKIEKYDSQQQDQREGDRIGYFVLNLATFVGQGLKTFTFPMDQKGFLYLTVKIVVIEASTNVDIATITLQSLNNRRTEGTTTKDPTNMLNELDESESDDEQELGGGELMDTLTYFYDVYKEREQTVTQNPNA